MKPLRGINKKRLYCNKHYEVINHQQRETCMKINPFYLVLSITMPMVIQTDELINEIF